jgi:YesN/AraC family two-component response regulator
MKAGFKIVIADDDRVTRSVLRLLLLENKYNVIGEAIDGIRAVEMCVQLKPDIAFLDIDMPRMSGNEAAAKILHDNPKIKIIMVSALASLENVQSALQSGASGFVVKPFSTQKIIEAITRTSQPNLPPPS